MAIFYLAQMLKMEGRYKEAEERFNEFRRSSKGLNNEREMRNIIRNELEGIQIADSIIKNPKQIKIWHLDRSINSLHVDLSPYPLDNNTLIYSSLKLDTLNYFIPNDTANPMPVRKFYMAKRYNDSWKGTGETELPFNMENVNSGNGTLSPDGLRFYFTRCEKNWKNETICRIFVSKNEDNNWTIPEEVVELNHPQFSSTQPTIGNDSRSGEEVIYFSSNRPGGQGGYDIWYAVYNSRRDVYRAPRNAGRLINTYGDELTPWFDIATRTLYFSSNGHPTIGGLDVFSTNGELRTWTAPENLGSPINTSTDELYYVLTPSREDGFFVSNRKGGFSHRSPTCCDDIYYFRKLDFIRIGVTGKVLAINDSSIYKILEQQIEKHKNISNYDEEEEDEIEPAKGAIVNLFWQSEKNNQEFFIARDTVKSDGTYFFNLESEKIYKLVVENFGFFNKTITTSTVGFIKSDTIQLDAIYINKIPLEPLIIRNIYYAFDKSDLTKESELILDSTIYRIMIENPTIIVEISSHTDILGTMNYNMRLSQRRAESVIQYLIRKGINKERLQAKGYGSTVPIEPNTNPDGSDNPEGRQKNRRTEFRIIGSLDQYSTIRYEE